jgi:hypothetical protein
LQEEHVNPKSFDRLEQLRSEARIEHLLRAQNPNAQTLNELERLTKLVFSLRFWGVQLEVRKWVTQ